METYDEKPAVEFADKVGKLERDEDDDDEYNQPFELDQ